ncbi:MAG TPA: OB-fold domain-containing protein [Bryobacteraceae bacterium]|nr:OB-fold domain-containing protein [Bryobacteraceae bacterium]
MSAAVLPQTTGKGVVYTETIIYSAPPKYLSEVPYQIAIVELENGRRMTVRIVGDQVSTGDRVAFAEFRNEVPCFKKAENE